MCPSKQRKMEKIELIKIKFNCIYEGDNLFEREGLRSLGKGNWSELYFFHICIFSLK